MKTRDEADRKSGNNLKWFILIPTSLLLVLSIVLFIIFREQLFYNRIDYTVQKYAPTEEMLDAIDLEGYVPSYMLSKTKELLIRKQGTSPYILSWYLLPGQLESMTAGQSQYLEATDQILLMRLYVAKGDKKNAKTLMKAIDKDFTDDTGNIVGYRFISEISAISDSAPKNEYHLEMEDPDMTSGVSLEANCAYLRALLEYYSKWGMLEDWERIEELAALIYSDGQFLKDRMFDPLQDTDILVGLEDSQAYLEANPEINEAFPTLMLSALDLQAFRMLAEADEKYRPMYEEALALVEGGLLTDDLPIFSLAYSGEYGGYVYYIGKEAEVQLIPSLKTMLHLAEVGELPKESLAWVKEQIFNSGYLYERYDIISGNPTSEIEATEAYGLVLQIAVAVGDTDLYLRTLTRLERSLATLDTSVAKYLIFRNAESKRNTVTAKDNLQTMLGMR
jgi:hypothetical protein